MALSNSELAQKLTDTVNGWHTFVAQQLDWMLTTEDTVVLENPLTGASKTVTALEKLITDWEAVSQSEVKADADRADAAAALAEQWAEETEDIEVETGKFSSLHHASKSADSAAAAGTSETNAAASEAAAGTSETNAALSEAAAGASETNAAASESAAATSETNAASSAALSEDWAVEAEDVEVTPGLYSAYHWAQKAEAVAGGGALSTSPIVGDGTTGNELTLDLTVNYSWSGLHTFQSITVGSPSNGNKGAGTANIGEIYENDVPVDVPSIPGPIGHIVETAQPEGQEPNKFTVSGATYLREGLLETDSANFDDTTGLFPVRVAANVSLSSDSVYFSTAGFIGIASTSTKSIAANEDGIIISTTDGSTWVEETTSMSSLFHWVREVNGTYILSETGGNIRHSTDGSSWASGTPPVPSSVTDADGVSRTVQYPAVCDVSWDGSKYLVLVSALTEDPDFVGDYHVGYYVFSTTDFSAWTEEASLWVWDDGANGYKSFSTGEFLATWSRIVSGSNSTFLFLRWDDAVEQPDPDYAWYELSSGTISGATTPNKFNDTASPSFVNVEYNGSEFLFLFYSDGSDTTQLYTSSDGVTWTADQELDIYYRVHRVSYTGTYWLLLTDNWSQSQVFYIPYDLSQQEEAMQLPYVGEGDGGSSYADVSYSGYGVSIQSTDGAMFLVKKGAAFPPPTEELPGTQHPSYNTHRYIRIQ